MTEPAQGVTATPAPASTRIAWILGALCFFIQFSLCGRYGYFRDELYYLACSHHLAFGYVDFAPVILGNGTHLAMNPLEPLFWMGTVYVLLLAMNRNQPKLLLWCGVLLGFGLLNKHSTVFFLAALVAGLALSPQRRVFTSKWFWIAAAIAFAIALPNVIWQIVHHFPTLEDLSNVKRTHKNVELPPWPFFYQQIMMLDPFNAIVWLGGLGFLL